MVEKPSDIIKDPVVLEFIGLKSDASYSESDLESAIISRLQDFLLEMGKGFLFEARQKRFTFEERHFYVYDFFQFGHGYLLFFEKHLYTARAGAHFGDALEPRLYISAVGLFCLDAFLGLDMDMHSSSSLSADASRVARPTTQPAPRAQRSR